MGRAEAEREKGGREEKRMGKGKGKEVTNLPSRNPGSAAAAYSMSNVEDPTASGGLSVISI